MEIALLLVAMAVAVLAFTALADRLDFPAPLLLIAVGVAGSYLPGVPEIHLEAEVVLLGLLPPLLYAAAIQTSLVDFNANRRAILLLSVGLVIFTRGGGPAPVVGLGAARTGGDRRDPRHHAERREHPAAPRAGQVRGGARKIDAAAGHEGVREGREP